MKVVLGVTIFYSDVSELSERGAGGFSSLCGFAAK